VDELKTRLQPVIDQLPESVRDYWWAFALAIAAVVLLLLWALFERVVLRPLFGRRAGSLPGEEYLRVDVATLPRPNLVPSPRRLLAEGVPVRVRLVVLAPLGHGRRHALPDDPAAFLDRVLPGFGAVVREDGAAVKLWPAQVSRAGFSPKFHTLVATPDPPGVASRWVLAAGPVRSGDRQFSLGLALEADEPCYLGRLTVTPDRWPWLLRIRQGAA
jgi:hypothetical protein